MPELTERPLRVAVCGSARTSDSTLLRAAEEIGKRLAEAGAVLVCGGLGGVMEAAARGAARVGGLTIGVLPGTDANAANASIRVPLATGLGEGRNVLVVRASNAVIAVGGEWGTLSEVALARKIGVPVILFRPALAASLGLPEARTAERAVGDALAMARRPA
ncbi:MAG TPA: TIGR00725 family protein [Longimicrobiales bacterium]|nr:TIGR00725 family protein [Longimicrobiales bacterium]